MNDFNALLLLGAIMFGTIFVIKNKKGKQSPWTALAKSNNLQLTPVRPPYTGPSVVGVYRDCHLGLHTMAGVTILKLSASHPMNDKSVPEIKKLLQKPVNFEDVARVLTDDTIPKLTGKISVGFNGQVIHYEKMEVEKNLRHLKKLFNLFSDLINLYPQVIVLGGNIVPLLQKIVTTQHHVLHPIAVQWLDNIGTETTARLGYRASQLICSACLTRCSTHTVSVSSHHTVTYYGCRSCGQSQEFLEFSEVRIIAMLDNQMEQEQIRQNETLRVNWLDRRKLFDFDEVEIIEATDEDAERFAVQIGNDTDIVRKPHYKEMRCTVKSSSQLSENTLRILRKTFKCVEMQAS